MASGGGSNFKAIIDRIGEGDLEAQCKFLITNNGGCGAVNHAKTYGVPVFHISGKTHPDQAEYEAALLEVIDKYDIDLLILAGYMKAIPTSILRRLPDRVLNIHPSLLPKFGGRGFYGHSYTRLFLPQAKRNLVLPSIWYPKKLTPVAFLPSERCLLCLTILRKFLLPVCLFRNTTCTGVPSRNTAKRW